MIPDAELPGRFCRNLRGDTARGVKPILLLATLEKDDIRKLIPHAGNMCLLDKIIAWDDRKIDCLSNTHLDGDNPLRFNGRLPAIALIEYGAQAAAVHGSLLSSAHGKAINQGYLAAINEAQFFVDELDKLTSSLILRAEIEVCAGAGVVYTFRATSETVGFLAEARVTVVHMAQRLAK